MRKKWSIFSWKDWRSLIISFILINKVFKSLRRNQKVKGTIKYALKFIGTINLKVGVVSLFIMFIKKNHIEYLPILN